MGICEVPHVLCFCTVGEFELQKINNSICVDDDADYDRKYFCRVQLDYSINIFPESAELIRHCKLVTASPEQVLELLDTEKQQLMVQLVDAEVSIYLFWPPKKAVYKTRF